MEKYFRRTWVEVNLDALKHNYETIESQLSAGSSIVAVVKADAYGHGVENTVREFSACGCRWFAVSNLEEALQVRSINSECSILILGYTPPKYAQTLAINNISQAVFDSSYAESLSAAATECGVQINIHIKVDTGMSRLGFRPDEIPRLIKRLQQQNAVIPRSVFSHFAGSDSPMFDEFTRTQQKRFNKAADELQEASKKLPSRTWFSYAYTVGVE